MTADKVVDASAAAAILFEEPERDDMIARLDGHVLHAPFLIAHEIANVCVKKIRRDPANDIRYLRAAALLQSFAIRLHPIDVRRVAETAQRHKLSAYDASYFWLAKELSAELVTLDRQLAKAAAT